MSTFLAIFPIYAPAPAARHHRAALNQLHLIVPDDVKITGTWTGTAWTDPDGREWWVMTAPATGPVDREALATTRATAHHIDPALAAWADQHTAGVGVAEQEPVATPRLVPARPRVEQLEELLAHGAAIEDAIRRCGWTKPVSASRAARRAGNLTLARTLEAAA